MEHKLHFTSGWNSLHFWDRLYNSGVFISYPLILMDNLCINPDNEKPVFLSPDHFNALLDGIDRQEKLGNVATIPASDTEKFRQFVKESQGKLYQAKSWDFIILKIEGKPARRVVRIEWLQSNCVKTFMKNGQLVHENIPGKTKIELESFVKQEEEFVKIAQHAALLQAF